MIYSRFLIWVLVVLAGVLVGCRHNPPPTPIEITRLEILDGEAIIEGVYR